MSQGIRIMYKARQFLTKKSFAYVVPCLYLSLYDILYWGLGLCFSNSTQLFIVASKENHKNNELLSLFRIYQSTFPFNGSSSFNKNVFV